MNSRQMISFLILALGVVGHCNPLSQEYGVPFDTYGLPEHQEIPEQRTLDIPEVPETPIVVPDIQEVGEVILSPPEKTVLVRDDKNQYSLGYQGPEGTEVKEQGRLISTDNGWEYVIAKTGSYKYISPEGIPIEVEWIADEKGFRILNA